MPDDFPMLAALMSHRTEESSPALSDPAAVEQHLVAGLYLARQTYPAVVVGDGDFIAYLSTRISEANDVAAAVLAKDVEETFLAAGCAVGVVEALVAMEKRCFDVIPPALRRMSMSDATIDDVTQVLRARLLVGEGGQPPRICAYAGDGDLRGFVRVAAVREALKVVRTRKRRGEVPHADGTGAMHERAVVDDPELAYLKQRHKFEFKQVFEQAVMQLSKQDRNVMRLHLVDGMTTEQIGALYGAHQTTVSRWLDRSRLNIAKEARRILRRDYGVGRAELNSVAPLIVSQLDLSLTRIFATRGPEEP